jgi:UDP-N-acetylmuramoyl-L-alanyl-D-glutamate--2,6-diaminopimelate ligase
MRSALMGPSGFTQPGISLRELLPSCKYFGGTPVPISSCCGDSRHCKPGDLFAAIVGRENDGHDYAEEAVRKGAVTVLAERPIPVGVPTCIVGDTREAFGQICQSLAGNPSGALRAIGVSGSYGKTMTSLLIASILETAGEPIGILGSLGYCDGRKILTDAETTPTSPELARWLAQSAHNGCTHAIIEASSAGLADKRLSGLELDAAVMTNVRRAHLDLHASVLNYRRIKERLFHHLRPDGFAVMNADDPASKHMIATLNRPLITIGMQSDAEVTAEPLEYHHSEQTFLLTAGEETMPVRTSVIGRAHIYNCLSAAAVGLVLGHDLTTIVRGLEAVDSIPGRMERIDVGQSFVTYVDAAKSPDCLASTLKSLRRVTRRRLICVYGAGSEGDSTDRPLLGRVVENHADIGVITRNDPRNEDPLQIAHEILDGYDRPAQAHWLPDRAKAIGWSLAEARPGDTVLIAGRGDEKYEIVDGKRLDFDDREVVRAFLEEMDKIEPARKIA